MTWKERMILILLASLNFTHILDFMIMMPLGNFLIPHFKISSRMFSFIVACYPATAFISGLVAAFYVDQFDRKKVLLFAYIGFIAGTISCGFAPDPYFLAAARVLTGLFGGLIGAQVLSIVADTFAYEKRGRAMGAIFAAFSVASVIGVPFSLYLSRIYSWHAPFIFIGLLGIGILPLIFFYLPPMRKHIHQGAHTKPKVGAVLREILGNRQQVMALILSGCLMLGHFLIIPFINPYMEFNRGFSKTQTPLIYMVGGICAFASSFIIGRLADRYGKLPVFVISAVLSLIPIFFITNMPVIPFAAVLSVFGFWFAFSSGRTIPAQAMISNVVNPEHRGLFMSFNSSLQQLFTALASLIGGAIVVSGEGGKIYNYNWVGYLSVAVIFATIFIAAKLSKLGAGK
jgi:MFS transporter, DHA1 family, inner membrane transport protein